MQHMRDCVHSPDAAARKCEYSTLTSHVSLHQLQEAMHKYIAPRAERSDSTTSPTKQDGEVGLIRQFHASERVD